MINAKQKQPGGVSDCGQTASYQLCQTYSILDANNVKMSTFMCGQSK